MLSVYTFHNRNHVSLIIARRNPRGGYVELHSKNRIEIAVAVLNNYVMKLAWDDEYAAPMLYIFADREDELFETLGQLQKLDVRIKRDEEFDSLLNNPTLERLKAFIMVKKLLEN
ncbi:MAG: hypothetical protein QXO20_04600 [Candidatus Bathyarchaeia archaeon]